MFSDIKDEENKEKELPSLDRFLGKNTSEDNASFEQIMEVAEDKEKLKHSWLYEAESEFKQVCTFMLYVRVLRLTSFIIYLLLQSSIISDVF